MCARVCVCVCVCTCAHMHACVYMCIVCLYASVASNENI